MKYYTYIIEYENKKYYVGHTSDLESRLLRHKLKTGAKFTAQNVPTKIVWNQKFDTELDAIRRERQIKGWSRAKKEKLIRGYWK